MTPWAEIPPAASPGESCPTCGKKVSLPDEAKPSRGPRIQWNIQFDTVEARDQTKQMVAELRAKYGLEERKQAGTIVHLAVYGQVTGQVMEPGE